MFHLHHHHKGPILEIENMYDDEELQDFETVAMLEKDKTPFSFDPHSNVSAKYTLQRYGYFPWSSDG